MSDANRMRAGTLEGIALRVEILDRLDALEAWREEQERKQETSVLEAATEAALDEERAKRRLVREPDPHPTRDELLAAVLDLKEAARAYDQEGDSYKNAVRHEASTKRLFDLVSGTPPPPQPKPTREELILGVIRLRDAPGDSVAEAHAISALCDLVAGVQPPPQPAPMTADGLAQRILGLQNRGLLTIGGGWTREDIAAELLKGA
jgi:hypothetical protein